MHRPPPQRNTHGVLHYCTTTRRLFLLVEPTCHPLSKDEGVSERRACGGVNGWHLPTLRSPRGAHCLAPRVPTAGSVGYPQAERLLVGLKPGHHFLQQGQLPFLQAPRQPKGFALMPRSTNPAACPLPRAAWARTGPAITPAPKCSSGPPRMHAATSPTCAPAVSNAHGAGAHILHYAHQSC
jgi:hypothetical protein